VWIVVLALGLAVVPPATRGSAVAPAIAGSAVAPPTAQPDSVVAFDAPALVAAAPVSGPLVGIASTPDGNGYWLVAADGAVTPFGDATTYPPAVTPWPVVGMAADDRTGGYWLVSAAGAVLGFDAPLLGSLAGVNLNQPVVGVAATPDGGGYWLVAADGGVFAFGDARFQGSTGGIHLARPVVGMAADAATGGYWLLAADGGVFAFDAPFLGSAASLHLRAPVVAMAGTPDDGGYWLAGADGGVFTYGDAPFAGAALTSPMAPAVGIAAGPAGYWVAYGHAAFVLSGPPPPVPASPDGGPGTFGPTSAGVLSGMVVALDPGHNGGNGDDPSYIDAPIWNGRETEACDTAGSETDSGYTEAQFNFNVAEYLTADLRAEGATVVLTRTTNTGVGPCVTERAAIGNNAHADAALSIHADGGPPGGRGFAILEPVADGINNAIIAPSDVLGTDLRDAFAAGTGEQVSSYDGVDGIQPRDDLGGTNLSTVPKVFIECANMRNAADAALVTSPAWQAQAAGAIATGLITFLTAG